MLAVERFPYSEFPVCWTGWFLVELKDWLTISASLVVGLGSSGLTNWLNVRKANADRLEVAAKDERVRRHDRNRTLREYLRVLEEVSADWENNLIFRRSSTIKGTARDHIREARESAYHYFHLFSDSEKWRLMDPLDYDGPHEQLALDHFHEAVLILRRFLADNPDD